MKSVVLILLSVFSFIFLSFQSFRSGLETPSSGWTALTSTDQVDQLYKKSAEKPVLIFKHSTACNISKGAKRHLEKRKIEREEVDAYYLDLLVYRSVSNYVEEKTGVKHESPQVIVLHQGKVLYSASHTAIKWKDIKKHIRIQ